MSAGVRDSEAVSATIPIRILHAEVVYYAFV